MGKLCLRGLTLSLLIATWAVAQQSPTPALAPRSVTTPAPVAPNATGRIHLDLVVTDSSGKPVSGLDVKDFAVLDNNLPSPILSFHAFDPGAPLVEPPIEVILVVDDVNLAPQGVALARQDVARYLRQNGGHLAQPTSLFILTDTGMKARLNPTTDGNALAEELDQTVIGQRSITPSQGVNGAVERFQKSIQMMTAIASAEAKKPGRKLLIWAGPGWPMLDRLITDKGQQQFFDRIVELSTRLREARIAVYSISRGESHLGMNLYQDYLEGVKTVEKAAAPDLALKVIAVQTGGRVFLPVNDLAGQIDQCVQDAGAYYTLSFDPPRADRANEYHDLKVQIDKPALTVRTRTGYYNQPN